MLFDKHVFIAIPSTGMARVESLLDATAISAYCAAHLPRVKVELNSACSSLLLHNRHGLVRIAQERRATHMLWIDDDMSFPPDTLARLLRHEKAVVGANYTTRRFPVVPLANKEGRAVQSNGKRGLEEVDSVGMGLMLTSMDVFNRIKPPWFMLGWSAKHDEYVGEDVWFCRAVKAAGYKVYVDHDLSVHVKHWGAVEFGHDLIADYQPTEIKKEGDLHKRTVLDVKDFLNGAA